MAVVVSTFASSIAVFTMMVVLLSCKMIRSQEIDSSCKYPSCNPMDPKHEIPVYEGDVDPVHFAMNLEFLEAEWFMRSSLGYGLDDVAPELANGGPPPIDGEKANLDPFVRSIIEMFAFEEIGHLRAINNTVGGIPRPLLDLRASNFAKFMDQAFGHELVPPFDPYRDSLSYMMAAYTIPYMGLVGYVGAMPRLKGYRSKRLVAGLEGVEAGQDAIIRMYLYERAYEIVYPYKYTVGEFTARISALRNRLAGCGIKDEGVIVPPYLGAENRTTTNVLAANYDSLTYRRTPEEILRVVYDSGSECVPGGFFPHGANGRIARKYLKS